MLLEGRCGSEWDRQAVPRHIARRQSRVDARFEGLWWRDRSGHFSRRATCLLVWGRVPRPRRLRQADLELPRDKGTAGEFAPPCATQALSSLGHGNGYQGQYYPGELLNLRLFKWRQGFWLVVPGLLDERADDLAVAPHFARTWGVSPTVSVGAGPGVACQPRDNTPHCAGRLIGRHV